MSILLQIVGGIVLAALLLSYIRYNYYIYHDLRLVQKNVFDLETKYNKLKVDYNDLEQQLQHKHQKS